MKSPIRRLHRITYWVIEDPDAIYDFINTNLRREWEADARSERRRPEDDNRLVDLSMRKWKLEVVQTSNVRLNPHVTGYVDKDRGYNFAASLEKRAASLSRDIETYATVIWPIIIRG